jgi:HEAT repeat protein
MARAMIRVLVSCCIVVVIAVAAIYSFSFLSYVIGSIMTRREVAEIDQLARRFEHNTADTEALDAIREIVRNGDSFPRTYACVALRRLGKSAGAATPDLIRALQSGDPFVEREAARALGTVAAGREDAVWPLIDKLQYEDDDVGWFAASSLGEIGLAATPAIPFLKQAAKSQNELMAEDATKALLVLKRLRDQEEL